MPQTCEVPVPRLVVLHRMQRCVITISLPMGERLTRHISENVYICVKCDTEWGGITAGSNHQDTHALVRCQYLENPMNDHFKNIARPFSCISSPEPRTPFNEMHQLYGLLHRPMKAARALGAKVAASLSGWVHG